jgi:hypothetical protein
MSVDEYHDLPESSPPLMAIRYHEIVEDAAEILRDSSNILPSELMRVLGVGEDTAAVLAQSATNDPQNARSVFVNGVILEAEPPLQSTNSDVDPPSPDVDQSNRHMVVVGIQIVHLTSLIARWSSLPEGENSEIPEPPFPTDRDVLEHPNDFLDWAVSCLQYHIRRRINIDTLSPPTVLETSELPYLHNAVTIDDVLIEAGGVARANRVLPLQINGI